MAVTRNRSVVYIYFGYDIRVVYRNTFSEAESHEVGFVDLAD